MDKERRLQNRTKEGSRLPSKQSRLRVWNVVTLRRHRSAAVGHTLSGRPPAQPRLTRTCETILLPSASPRRRPGRQAWLSRPFLGHEPRFPPGCTAPPPHSRAVAPRAAGRAATSAARPPEAPARTAGCPHAGRSSAAPARRRHRTPPGVGGLAAHAQCPENVRTPRGRRPCWPRLGVTVLLPGGPAVRCEGRAVFQTVHEERASFFRLGFSLKSLRS